MRVRELRITRGRAFGEAHDFAQVFLGGPQHQRTRLQILAVRHDIARWRACAARALGHGVRRQFERARSRRAVLPRLMDGEANADRGGAPRPRRRPRAAAGDCAPRTCAVDTRRCRAARAPVRRAGIVPGRRRTRPSRDTAPPGRLLERFQHDGVEVAAQAARCAARAPRSAVADPTRGFVAAQGTLGSQQLVQHDAQRKDVRARRDGFAANLLGRRVVGGEQAPAELRFVAGRRRVGLQ